MNKTVFAYNKAAKNYEEKFSQYDEYLKQISHFSDLFSRGQTILDLGCGPGLNTGIFSQKGLSVTGVDNSSEMIRLAKTNCPEGFFQHTSVTDFLTQKKFDGICLSFIIVHLETDKVVEFLQRISRYIQPEGKLYISFMSGKKPGYEKTSFSENEIYFNYFDKDFIISVLEDNGFILISSNTAPYEETNGEITEDHFLIFKSVKY
ncbi:MAG: class I SAM-dependent methyltransferase [Bacteroidetes bacterium]|nr:class I SAM-dependent methyltransferase [Bacteroidota bacterium]